MAEYRLNLPRGYLSDLESLGADLRAMNSVVDGTGQVHTRHADLAEPAADTMLLGEFRYEEWDPDEP